MVKISLKKGCGINNICIFAAINKKTLPMNMTDVFYGIGHFFQWSFRIMKHVGFGANLFFWLLIVSLVITWLTMQMKFNKEAKEKGTLA